MIGACCAGCRQCLLVDIDSYLRLLSIATVISVTVAVPCKLWWVDVNDFAFSGCMETGQQLTLLEPAPQGHAILPSPWLQRVQLG